MRRSVPILSGLALAAGLILAVPGRADAQVRHDQHRYDSAWSSRYDSRSNRAPSAFDWRGQLDRPGDYRCDAYWDANRTDCGAPWRDQRHRTSRAAWNTGHGYASGRYRSDYGRSHDRGYNSGYGYSTNRRGYGHAGAEYGAAAGVVYPGAYGRPDLVYPEVYGRYDRGVRDARRVDWCLSRYRSYDPSTGYYRAWSGRRVFCG